MLPVQLTIRDIPNSAPLETHIREKIEKLQKYFNRITSCHVTIELPQKHKHQGKLFNIRIMTLVPGKELIATHKSNEDVYIAIRDAFNAMGRQLEEHARKRHGRVKTHDNVMHGHVARLLQDEGYGFIEGVDGNEYYFSITNVSHPRFQQLSIGDWVEYIPKTLRDGRQAHHVVREKLAA